MLAPEQFDFGDGFGDDCSSWNRQPASSEYRVLRPVVAVTKTLSSHKSEVIDWYDAAPISAFEFPF